MTDKKGIVTVTEKGMIPQDFEGLWRMASVMHASKMMPQAIDSIEKVMVCVQMGFEIGLSPMQAVQNIAVINGRPTIWGDAALALVESSGLLEDFSETIETGKAGSMTAICTAKRKGRSTPIISTFSTEDAAAAGLLGKSGPWKTYPKRMLQLRARGFALRDGFPDVLKGLKTAEEERDNQMIPVSEPARSATEIENLLIENIADPLPVQSVADLQEIVGNYPTALIDEAISEMGFISPPNDSDIDGWNRLAVILSKK